MPAFLSNVNFDLAKHPIFQSWQRKGSEAKSYETSILPDFKIRDENYTDSFNLRHGLVEAKIPPSHRVIVPDTTSKESGEILNRLVAILTSVYPKWIFHADSLRTNAGLRASELSTFCRSIWLAVEDRVGTPIIRSFVDQQLGYGGAFFHVPWRGDRWQDLPERQGEESTRDFNSRVRAFKARNVPIDITVPEYNTVYYDLSVDGIVRLLRSLRISVFEAAAQFGGWYDSRSNKLHIPVELPVVDDRGDLILDDDDNIQEKTHVLEIPASREVNYLEYWNKTDSTVTYMLEGLVVRVEDLDSDLPLPWFLGLGEVTSSPDPGRMGLPVLYNGFEAFERKIGIQAMEWAFLYKHGFARMVRKRRRESAPGATEPDLPDQELEEEEIGELVDLEVNEDLAYITPANVSALFADAKADVNKEIDNVALADILTGKIPPAGTTGFLMSQLATAATAKYIPILTQTARAIRQATLYMLDLFDKNIQSSVVVPVQVDETTQSPFVTYKPNGSKGNRNLSVEIEAPLPSDQIARTQWLAMGNKAGYVSKERVQRQGYKIDQPELENEKMRLERFQEFYEPIAMLKAQKRAGQLDQVLEAAQAGLLPPALAQLALAFAAGPEGLTPEGITGNPSGTIQAQPGVGQPAVPPVGLLSGGGGGGRAAGAERRPGGPRPPPNITGPTL